MAERSDMSPDLEKRLGHVFHDRGLLAEALTHRSYRNEHPESPAHNARLEFLGDAVIGLVVAQALMEMCPASSEGDLTRRRAALVSETSLAAVARRLGIGADLRLGRGEDLGQGRDRPSILADALEALAGAIFLDAGYETARDVVLRWLEPLLEETARAAVPDDAKSRLQSLLQASGMQPTYRLVSEGGPDHDKVYEIEVVAAGRVLARGRGRSKQDAEQAAAGRALGQEEKR